MNPYFEQVKRNSLDVYQTQLGCGDATDKVDEIVPAAEKGRIDTLLIDPDAFVPNHGRTMHSDGHIEICKREAELLDRAVRFTLSRGGNVCAVSTRDLPSQSPVGAILRY
jgi:hypothetical protein